MTWTTGLGRRRGLAALVGVALLVAACSSGDDDGATADDDTGDDAATAAASDDAVYPGGEWERGDAAELGFDPEVLDQLAADAEANESNCVVVVRHGRIAAEWYWNGTDAQTAQEIFSTTKSVTSTLVGIAQADGDLDVADRAAEYIPEWEGTDSADVTVEDLLANDSGRHWENVVDDIAQVTQQGDRTGYAIGLGQDVPPGERWAYNNTAIQTLDAVVETATGVLTRDFASERLFEPTGMADSEMTPDPAGNTNTFFGMQSTCEDLARFGYLFLRQGTWDGTEVVPADWVEAATGAPSQDLNAGYGYLWWLNRVGPQPGLGNGTGAATEEAAEGQAVPDAPEDMYWALGLGGQVVQVDPGSDTVVVRLGSGNLSPTYGNHDTARFVTEALVDP
jgi:CubicO group peptidase (beta-lactamase class C family)